MFTIDDALLASQILGIKFDKFSINDLLVGMNIELEHGSINPFTNVTNDDLIVTTKIALAHLNEYSDYYNNDYGLPALERFLEHKKRTK